MKIPFVLPVYYDEYNETINDKNHAVIYHCGWPSHLTYEQKKEKGLFLVAMLNGDVCVHKDIDTGEYSVLDEDSMPDSVIVESNGHSKSKQHGNKGRVYNPWGRAGKPK